VEVQRHECDSLIDLASETSKVANVAASIDAHANAQTKPVVPIGVAPIATTPPAIASGEPPMDDEDVIDLSEEH
jgi:hypothetical protein